MNDINHDKLKDREQILNRCSGSAFNVGLDELDLNKIINHFEYSDMEESEIGNIIKYICVLIEERISYNREAISE